MTTDTTSARPINAIAAECGITGVDEAALSRFAAAVLAAGYPALGALRIASVHRANGQRLGLRLSVGDDMCVVFDDQVAMPGIRAGEFVAEYGDILTTRVLR